MNETDLSMTDTRPRASNAGAQVAEETPDIGIFRTVYPLVSETFITEQARALRAFRPRMVVRDACDAVTEREGFHPGGRLAASVWTATRWPGCFPVSAMKKLRLIHAHFGPDAVMALPLARKLRIPLVSTFHGADITVDLQKLHRRPRMTEAHFARHEAALQHEGQRFIAVSEFIQKQLIARGYPEHKVEQVYIGVDLDRFKPKDDADPSAPRYVLCVGRHTEKKGIETLVRAWAKVERDHPDVLLKQVGSGDITAQLHLLARQLGIEGRIEWLGPQRHQAVLELMRGAEVFALPSQTAESGDSEALGIVFNEASACGVPVASTWHGGIPEAVRHGETGLLSDERDVDQLAANLHALLADREFSRRLGRQGRVWVEQRFDLSKQTRRLEAIYASAIEAHGSTSSAS